MKHTRKHIVKGLGKQCPKCFNPTERREHADLEIRAKKQKVYFSEWDYCKSCHHVQHYEEFKVVTNSGRDLANYIEAKEESLNLFEIAMSKE